MAIRHVSEGVAALRDQWWLLVLVVAALGVTIVLVTEPVTGRSDAAPIANAPDQGYVVAAPSTRAPSEAQLACAGVGEQRLVKVSLGDQWMWFCEGDRLVESSAITSGSVARGHGTPLGTWHIVSRETNRYLNGPDYRVFVRYWLPFFRDFGFHDSPWQRFPYGDRTQYKTNGSRGCIRVPGPTMAELYRWVSVGTTVTITP